MDSKMIIALSVACAALPLAGCVGEGYGSGGVAIGYGSPYAYDGFYDDYYGPIYDGYWGGDGFFYYRRNAGEHGFRRGDAHHFARAAPAQGHFHAIQGTMTPQRGMHMPRFGGGTPRHR
jgi:hypothetical protein